MNWPRISSTILLIHIAVLCSHLCTQKCHAHAGHEGIDEEEFEKNKYRSIFDIQPKVWLASIVAITVISAVGLMGVAVVPLVTKMFYNHVIQFLVALAVGTLTGDAFLHLLPHAIVASVLVGQTEIDHENKQTVFKGLVALGGIYFFFMAEKLLYLFSEYRAEQKAIKEENQRVMQNPNRKPSVANRASLPRNSVSNIYVRKDSTFARRLSRALESGDDVMTVGMSSRAMRSIDNLIRYTEPELEDEEMDEMHSHSGQKETSTFLSVPGQSGMAAHQTQDDTKHQDTELTLLVPSVTIKKEDSHQHKHDKDGGDHQHDDNDSADGHSHGDRKPDAKEAGGHGHGHGHSHEVPKSIAAVAWMVILGDGLHNFSDGLAIGAAFAQGIAGGLSTAVAVFCHELPHELGDFAVLLKTGMEVKVALFYNIVSSVLCFVGMLIGISLGNIQTASFWIFAIAGGMFVYIALVDMLPELNTANVKPGESRILHFVLQIMGITTGVGIMLLIALYEDDIKAILDKPATQIAESLISNKNATHTLRR